MHEAKRERSEIPGLDPSSETDLMGAQVLHGALDRERQAALLADLRDVVRAAPFLAPVTPGGRKMSVRMTSAGRLGWVTDARGYRYEDRHPSGVPWPPIPELALDLWRAFSGVERLPDCCLVNYYGEGARMGMHQDRDEGDFRWPVLSISLGDDALFRVGGTVKGGPTRSVWLRSGDVVLLAGDARLAFHGIERLRFGTSDLLRDGGRINLTLRVVD
jgi:alkylated DNA repair protein (DNA oxidative demethylase)